MSEDSDSDDEPSSKRLKAKGSKGGSSCHQCKSRRNFTALTYCTSLLDKKNKKCRKKFCGHCLKKFYKELPAAPSEKGTWECPSCRRICCCAACRRRKDKEDTDGPVTPSPKTVKPKKNKIRVHDPNGPQGGEDDDDDSDDEDEEEEDEEDGGEYSEDEGIELMSGDTHIVYPSSSGSTRRYADNDQYNAMKARTRQDEDGGYDIQTLATRFPALLHQHIKKHAQTAVSDPRSPFASLYSLAHSPQMKRRITAILSRPDLTKQSKVEMIAEALRTTSIQNSTTTTTTSASTATTGVSNSSTGSMTSSNVTKPQVPMGYTQPQGVYAGSTAPTRVLTSTTTPQYVYATTGSASSTQTRPTTGYLAQHGVLSGSTHLQSNMQVNNHFAAPAPMTSSTTLTQQPGIVNTTAYKPNTNGIPSTNPAPRQPSTTTMQPGIQGGIQPSMQAQPRQTQYYTGHPPQGMNTTMYTTTTHQTQSK